MGVQDGLTVDLDRGRPSGAADTRPAPSFIDAAIANTRLFLDDSSEVNLGHVISGYNDLADLMIANGRSAARYHRNGSLLLGGKPDVPRDLYPVLWRDFDVARRAQPDRFKDIPASTQEDFEKWAGGRKGARAVDQDTAARGGFGTAIVPGLALGVTQSFAPENLPWLAAGGGETGIGMTIARQTLTGAQQQAVSTAEVARTRAQMGEGYSPGELAADIGMAGVAQGALVGAHIAAPKVAGAIADLVPLDIRVARELGRASPAEVSDLEVAHAFERTVPDPARSADEQAAVHAITREAEIDASNPYANTYAGAARHRERLDAAGARLIDPTTAPPPRTGGSLDSRIVSGLQARGFSEAHARGIAAGIHAEAASNPSARNPSSGAMGIGQWLGARKRAIVARYGEHPTLDQQLDFLAHELRGGDAGGAKVLAQGDEAAVLNSYIRDFMRPAAGKETDGDLARGMAALGRSGEEAPAGRYAEGDDAAARYDAEDADIEMERIRLDADRPDTPHVEFDPSEIAHNTDLPPLRPELFADETSLRLAQAAADAEALGLPEPVVTREMLAATVPQDAAGDGPLGPASVLDFQPKEGKPGISVINDEGHLATAVFRDEKGVVQGAVQMPISVAGAEVHPEVLSYVRPAFRRQGVATRLYDALRDAGHPIDELSGMGDLTPNGAAFVNSRRARADALPMPTEWVARNEAGEVLARGPSRPDVAAAARSAPGGTLAEEAMPIERAVGEAEIDRLGSDDRYADPIGPELQVQSERLGHDMKLLIDAEDPRQFKLADGSQGTVADLFEGLSQEDKAIAAVRGCL